MVQGKCCIRSDVRVLILFIYLFVRPPNSTGGYELDLSLVPDFSKAWRAMHPKSDVFCSGSLVLPDKGARQINIGGFAAESTFGIRLYTPDGSPGVNGTNDWEENSQELSLQVSVCDLVDRRR